MKLIIHDLEKVFNEKIIKLFNLDEKKTSIIWDDGSIKHCIGCFNCWVKTPGKCILKDKYNNMGALMGSTEEIIIISECVYGTYSPFVRNTLDRSLPYVHPNFTKRKGEMHHKSRYDNNIRAKVYFYGDISDEEKETARKIVEANMLNFNGTVVSVKFFENKEAIFNENSIN